MWYFLSVCSLDVFVIAWFVYVCVCVYVCVYVRAIYVCIRTKNTGSIGGTYARPIILVPQVMIGALGKFQRLPRYDENDDVRPATIMMVSWAGDHRVVDGATVARFSNLWKRYLEHPLTMLLETR